MNPLQVAKSAWIWTASATLILVWTALLAVVRLFDRDPLRRRTARLFRGLGPVLAKVHPWRVRVSGVGHIVPGANYVVVSNHQSLADIPLVSHIKLDSKWLAKVELFRMPVIGWMLKMAGDIPVERGDRRKGAQALLAAGRYLRAGCSVVFFPEGTRSEDGSVKPFSEGPFQLALREQVPVLPLVVHGSGSALPKATWLFSGRQDILLEALEPVPVEGRTTRESAELRDEVRQRIIDELARLRGGSGS